MASMKGALAKAKRVALREKVFPQSQDLVYTPDKGWRQLPRTIPLIMTLISSLAPKGKRDGAARVYLELWFRDYGEGCVELTDPDVHAFAAGYTTAGHGPRSWRECIDVLAALGFIKIEPKGSRSHGYALLFDPDKVVEELRAKKKVDAAWFNAYQQRKVEVGAG